MTGPKALEMERWVETNPCVMDWLNSLSAHTRVPYRYWFYHWMQWMNENGGEFRDYSPEQLLDFQDKAMGRGRRARGVILHKVQQFVDGLSARIRTKKSVYSVVRSFFGYHMVPLPRAVNFRVTSDRMPVRSKLDFSQLRNIILASNRKYRAVFLCMFQSFMGESEFEQFNRQWESVKEQLDAGKKRIKIFFTNGRKGNVKEFYTFIGTDAVAALREYLEQERGYVKKGEAIFLNTDGAHLTGGNIRRQFLNIAVKLGYAKRTTPPCPNCGHETTPKRVRKTVNGRRKQHTEYECPQCGAKTRRTEKFKVPKSVRYGYNPHEMRDVARSEWTRTGASAIAAEFFMGHTVDPNDYTKILKNCPEWAEEQYAIAEPWLNILGEDPRKVSYNRVQQLEKKVAELENKNLDLKQRLNGFTLSSGQMRQLLKRIEKLEEQAQKQT